MQQSRFPHFLLCARDHLMGLWCFLVMLLAAPAHADSFSHDAWDQLLQKHVVAVNRGFSTRVDYAGFQKERIALDTYLKSLTAVTQKRFASWSNHDQLAFLINAYNAFTIDLILTEYPDIESIKDFGSWFSSPWKKDFFTLLGREGNLGWIEHTLIRGDNTYKEPRIHFAVNCASIGCPPLLEHAYTGAKLEGQLEAQTKRFLADRQQNALKGDELVVSPIFKWYREDFEKGWGGYNTLHGFFAKYANTLGIKGSKKDALAAGKVDINFGEYDWGLNAVGR
jgi:hypothetical protein